MQISGHRKNEILVGLFVVIGIASLLAMTLIIRGNTGFRPYEIRVIYKSVAGLEIGSPVLVSGFRLGRVSEMDPSRDENGDPEVIVSAIVSRRIPIYKDAEVRLAQQGFLGDMRLEIHPGNPGAGEIVNNELLTSIPPLDLSSAFANAGEIIEDVKATLSSIREIVTDEERRQRIDNVIASLESTTAKVDSLLTKNQDNIDESIVNFRQVSKRAISVSEEIDTFMKQANERFDGIAEEAEGAIAQFRSDLTDMNGRLNDVLTKADKVGENADGLITESRQEIADLSQRVSDTSDQLKELLTSINEGKGTIGRFIIDPRPFDDLQESIAALKSFLLRDEEKLYDRSLLYRGIQPTKGPGSAGTPSTDGSQSNSR